MGEKEFLNFKGNERLLLLAGNPNVGKSVIFGLLTGKYVVVSNYPGTSVEITRGKARIEGKTYELLDSPGINGLIPFSEDERVTRDLLIDLPKVSVIQVVNSMNLSRALNLSLQLAEMEVPFLLDLNMTDEAKSRGIKIDVKKLKELLKIEVVSTVAVRNQGVDLLKKAVPVINRADLKINYGKILDDGLASIEEELPSFNISRRFIAVGLLCEDKTLYPHFESRISPESLKKIEKILGELRASFEKPLSQVIAQVRQTKVKSILDAVMVYENTQTDRATKLPVYFEAPFFGTTWMLSLAAISGFSVTNFSFYLLPFWLFLLIPIFCLRSAFIRSVEKASLHRFWGWFFLLGILIFTYYIVGVLGAGILVDFFEETAFGKYVNPIITRVVDTLLPFQLAHELLVDETSGIITVSLTYSIAIILPIVTLFFFVFGLLEDSGYLPRLAVIVNQIFKTIGLNGKAVLPMILGLGCDTMATMTARILPTPKERLIVTLLLALGIPCSAQLGVIMGMAGSLSLTFLMIMITVILTSLFSVGFLAAKLLPGKSSDFIQELPPIRVPEIRNILFKTFARIEWYLREAVPLFALGTFILFLFYKFHLIEAVQRFASPLVVDFLGLPVEATRAFIIGFLRRDYAATELFVMSQHNLLSPLQILVGLVTITLFLPCLANFFIIIKERGLKQALAISAFIFPFAFLVGGILNHLLRFAGYR